VNQLERRSDMWVRNGSEPAASPLQIVSDFGFESSLCLLSGDCWSPA
jgi:hypothetical protein